VPSRSASSKPFLRALAGEVVVPPPFWLMRQAGRYLPEYRETRATVSGFLELCYSPDKATEVTLQPLRRYGMDAAILFSDILVVPDALGQNVQFREGEGPVLQPVRSAADLDKLSIERFHAHLAPVYETVRRLSAAIPEQTALIGFAGAPWTVATYMVEGSGSKEFGEVKRMAYAEPALFQRIIDLLTQVTGDYLIAQIDAGAEAVQLFDSWAGVLPDDEFAKWVTAPASKIVARLAAERPGVPVIGFPRGAGALYERYVVETGVAGIGLDTTVPLDWAAKVLQPRCTVQGNLDPQWMVVGGEGLDRAVDRILGALGHGRFIFNLGHGITPQASPDNVTRLAERLRAWRP
jgi:uroporphyrinogen decarboxylase